MNQQIKALFKFIEFLHSNIQNFNQYDEVISDWVYSANQMNNLNPNKNSTDKLKYDNLEENFECNLKIIQKNIQEPIHSKATELNICDIEKEDTIWNWNYSEITNLKESFSKEDLPEILEHKRKYLEFRTKTNLNEVLMIFFVTLDTILKELFDYFNETDQNEFEAFEMKTIQAKSLSEAIRTIKPGHTKFTFSNSQSPLLKNETKSKQEQPIAFDELFNDASLVSVCIDILKEVTPPLIDTECNYIGKSKGAFCVWINELTRQGIVKHYSDRKIYASLLPQRIGRFNIDESMFGKHHKKAENQYRTDIKALVSKVKLSQISQKGKLGK